MKLASLAFAALLAAMTSGSAGQAEEPLVLKARRLDLRVRENLALARFDYTVDNAGALPREGEIAFSVPEGAAVLEAELAKNVSSKDRVSKLLPASSAARVYASVTKEVRDADVARQAADPSGANGLPGGLLAAAGTAIPLGDPALLELIAGSSYRLRFFPIMPRDDQKASFTFAAEAVAGEGALELRIPLSHDSRFERRKGSAESVRITFASAVENVSSPTHALRRDARGGYEAELGTSTELVLRYASTSKGKTMPDEWGRAARALRGVEAVTRENSLLVIDRTELKRRLKPGDR